MSALMQTYTRLPVTFSHGEGVYLYDTAGRRYLDAISSLWVTTLGHRVPELDDALRTQIDRVAHTTMLGHGNTVTVEPMRAFPPVRDLVTDVAWNFESKKAIHKFKPRSPDAEDGTWRMQQEDIERVQEFRKCIECFLCQDVCHVLREHQEHARFVGPRLLVYTAALEMHPLDVEDRAADLKRAEGLGYCNITKCCTNVCPENIAITDNAIIPLKERVADRFYDPLGRLFHVLQW